MGRDIVDVLRVSFRVTGVLRVSFYHITAALGN
jgi:hypothetical protein